MLEKMKPCIAETLLHLEPDKIKWKPANLSGLTLEDIFICYDDGLD